MNMMELDYQVYQPSIMIKSKDGQFATATVITITLINFIGKFDFRCMLELNDILFRKH